MNDAAANNAAVHTIRVVISGRVQGVGFRAWTVATAASMGLQGWVRNRGDGTVEAIFSGRDESVISMVEACKVGPPASRVNAIECFTCKEEVSGPFMAKPTA